MASGSNDDQRMTDPEPDVTPETGDKLRMMEHVLVQGSKLPGNRLRNGALLARAHRFVQEHAQEGDPASVIEALDRFAADNHVRGFVGDVKGPIVRKIVEETKPMVCLELGSMIGYSAIDAAHVLPQGSRYYCVEPKEERIEQLLKIVDYAGLLDTIHVIKGYSTDVIPRLKDDHGIDYIDYVFIDHTRHLYKSDLILLEDNDLLKIGTVVVADNVIINGSTDYLEYVRNSPKYRSEFFEGKVGYNVDVMDGLEKSTLVDQSA